MEAKTTIFIFFFTIAGSSALSLPHMKVNPLCAIEPMSFLAHPNKIDYHLYNKNNNNGTLIQHDDFSQLIENTKLHVVLQGWVENKEISRWPEEIVEEFLKLYPDDDVIYMDWYEYSKYLYYPWAACYVGSVGVHLGDFLVKIVQSGKKLNTDISIVGFSLGAHIAGYSGQQFNNKTGTLLGRIVGLDPAKPYFSVPYLVAKDLRLSDDDAMQVLCVHTFYHLTGVKVAIGTIDLYINGGAFQTTCFDPRKQPNFPNVLVKVALWPACSHPKAAMNYIATLRGKVLTGYYCETYKWKNCDKNNTITWANDKISPEGARGKYYVPSDV